jgi:Peptidase family M1 domain
MHVHVHLTDRMVNAGFRSLSHLDVRLPSGPSFGITRLSIRVDGSEVRALPVSQQAGTELRIPFHPPWPQRKTRTITFDYDFEPQAPGRVAVAATDAGFYLAAPNALPRWLALPGPFAVADVTGRKEQLDITAPSDFRVLAAGRRIRRRLEGASTAYRYRVPYAMGPAFVIAGRYRQQSVKTRQGKVIFWTLEPFDAQTAQGVAERIMQAFAVFKKIFGPAGNRSAPLRIVETSAVLAPPEGGSPDFSGASFPQGVLLDRRAIAKISTEPVLELVEYELARTWLGWRAQVDPDSELLLGRGLGLFAVALVAETTQGQTARQQDVAQLLADYEHARARAKDQPLIAPPGVYTKEQRAVDVYKAALFCVALEDLAGREKFEDAVRQMLQARQGRDLSYEDLRASLEFVTRRDLGEMFRIWLYRPGLPAAFRARYVPAS